MERGGEVKEREENDRKRHDKETADLAAEQLRGSDDQNNSITLLPSRDRPLDHSGEARSPQR